MGLSCEDHVVDLTLVIRSVTISMASLNTFFLVTFSHRLFSSAIAAILPFAGLSDWLADTGLEKISAQAAKLNSLSHKVVMEMAPEGTQYPSAAAAPAHLSYRVDRPFLYLIRDETTGALLFIGRVVNPSGLTI